MSAPQSAEESIQVIRQLMERATTYRVLSTTSAFSGALASFAVGGYLFMNGSSVGIGMFVGLWLAVLLVLDCVNSFLLFKNSKQRKSSFPSPQMIHAVITMLPGFLAGGVIGLVFEFVNEDPVRCATIWVVFAGLSLLGTSSFAPRSVTRLGWALLVSGLGLFMWKELGKPLPGDNSVSQASFVMMITFGLWSALYALWTGVIARKKAD